MAAKQLWDPRRFENTLRLPKTDITKGASCSHSGNRGETSASIVSPEKSKLNALASEFVSKAHLENSVENIVSELFSDDNFVALQYANDSLDGKRLKHLIISLTNNPGQFDNLFEIFRKTLRPYLRDIRAISNVTDLLVNQAVQEQSFRYTAARLCQSVVEDSPIFREQLYDTCKNELLRSASKQGIVFFVAELFTQLNNHKIYGQCLIDALKQLVEVGDDDNIKCVCQALKLTGYLFEQNHKEALDEIIALLKERRQFVTGTALCLLDSVMKLRNVNWGHGSPCESSSSNTGEGCYRDEGQHCPSVGNLSTEETAFLEASFQSTDEYLSDYSDPDELYDPEPEMDEEIQLAFKEFVKFSKK